LTTAFDETKELKEDIFQIAVDLLAAGLDPKKCVIFKQSDVPEHSELHLLFTMITPIPWLERVPTYKSKMEELHKDLHTYGFLGYPVLQAADILIYKADFVPVGRDQVPHLELTREIARRFNNFYGNVFPEPKELLTEFPVLPGIDGRKMSKSYNNTIALSDGPDTIRQKVLTMITDPARVKKDDPGHPEVCSVYAYHKIFNKEGVAALAQNCQRAEVGCVGCKKMLSDRLVEFLKDIYSRREKLVKDRKYIEEVLADGAGRASKVARATLNDAKRAMGLI
jgi:tryptophanyl-tRNA synthetase